MAWKQVTRGETKYFLNLDAVAFLKEEDNHTQVAFATVSADGKRMFIAVDQKPQEILLAEEVRA